MGIFVIAFTATGKTSLARNYKNVIDMESTKYKYLGECSENLKSTNRDINNDWPNNYFKALNSVRDKYDYILVADEIVNDFLVKNNYEYWIVYPQKELKEEYLKRCEIRGNNAEFIYWYSKLWDQWIDSCKNDKHASKCIELASNQYLEDVLPNLKKENY
ncbi:MAG: hypothetical protein IJR82_05430 [Bacilli bacterium]|nr:hypothetical protein [Bacilli bacterium]